MASVCLCVGRVSPAICSFISRAGPLYATSVRSYAHKRPTPKPRPPKPPKGKKALPEDQPVDGENFNEEEVVWQDDPFYEEKMAKLFPDSADKFGEDIDDDVDEGPEKIFEKVKKNPKPAVDFGNANDKFHSADTVFNDNIGDDMFDLEPPSESERKEMAKTKVYYKQVIEKSDSSKSDMNYIRKTLKSGDIPKTAWQEWKDDDDIIERQKASAAKAKAEEEEDEEGEKVEKKKPTKKEKDKPAKTKEIAKARKNDEDDNRLYVGDIKVPTVFDKYFQEDYKELEPAEKEKRPELKKKRKGFREQFATIQPRVRQLRIAPEVQEIVEEAIFENTTFFLPYKAKMEEVGLVISEVEMTRDLRYADVFWYADNPAKRAEYEIKLQKLRPYLRKQIATKMLIKFIPDLRFFYDEQDLVAINVERLIERDWKRAFGDTPMPLPLGDNKKKTKQ